MTLATPASRNTNNVASYTTPKWRLCHQPLPRRRHRRPTAPASGNGVYRYGGNNTTGIFPNSTFSASNYFADVVFTPAGANAAPTAVADTGDATEKGGVANGSGGSSATGNVLTNDTDPDAGNTKTVTAVNFGATAGTLGTALAGAHGSLVLNASGAFTYTATETTRSVAALAPTPWMGERVRTPRPMRLRLQG